MKNSFCCLDCSYLVVQLPQSYFCKYKKISIGLFAIEHRFFCYDCEIALFSSNEDKDTTPILKLSK